MFGLGDRFGGDGAEGAVEVVDGFDEVGGEAGDGEGAGGVDVAFGSVLKVAEVGDGAEVFVLRGGGRWSVEYERVSGLGAKGTFKSMISFFLASRSSFRGPSTGASVADASFTGASVPAASFGVSVAVE